MPTLRLLFVVLAFVVQFSPERTAAAQPDTRASAKQHYENGRALFAQGKYQDAIAEFQTADQLAPSGVNDFNIGYAYDQLGDAANAVKYYQSYLTRVPDAGNKSAVQDSIARLNQQLAAEAQAKSDADAAAAAKAKADADAAAAAKAKADADAAAHQPPVPPSGTGTAASTGDPDLDRVNAIDVGSVRDQRRGTMPAGAVASNAGAPPGPGTPPGPGAPTPVGESPKKSKPLYKQWWFWVVAGVSAYVLVSILTSSSSSNQPGTGALDMPQPVAPTPSAGLAFHF